jgi:hypothetical protein
MGRLCGFRGPNFRYASYCSCSISGFAHDGISLWKMGRGSSDLNVISAPVRAESRAFSDTTIDWEQGKSTPLTSAFRSTFRISL